MDFELIGEIRDVELIAKGPAVRVRHFLRRQHGDSRWRKLKGIARVRLTDGRMLDAEIHSYEAHGIGRKEFKIVRSAETE